MINITTPDQRPFLVIDKIDAAEERRTVRQSRLRDELKAGRRGATLADPR